MKTMTKLWIGVGVMALLSPLGLLAKGTAWGEWSAAELSQRTGLIPAGLERLESTWTAAVEDYNLPGWMEVPGYLLSAALGIAVTAGLVWLLGRWLSRGKGR